MAKDKTARERAVRELAANEMTNAQQESHDNCGPEPQRPDYYSNQAVRDRYYAWKLCKAGA